MGITRRAFVATAAAAGAVAMLPDVPGAAETGRGRVVVVKTTDRARAVAAVLDALDFTACAGRHVALKANFNSEDAFPASTHPDTLAALLAAMRERKAARVVVGERSGMGDTTRVLERTGAADVVEKARGELVVLDDLPRDAWRPFTAESWPSGFHAARMFTDAECAVQTMCCKTHRFGGHVTLSLKNTVGLVAKRLPGDGHDYMKDLHRSSAQRSMIAEANRAWGPGVNVMDCLEAFVDGGPEQGTRTAPGVFLASTDRCALDAAAIALLRMHGMRGPAARGAIAETAQLARALALGLGAPPRDTRVDAVDAGAREIATRLNDMLARG